MLSLEEKKCENRKGFWIVFVKFRALVLGGCPTTMRLKKKHLKCPTCPINQIWINPHTDSLPMWLHHKSEKKKIYPTSNSPIVLCYYNEIWKVLITNLIFLN
jgi:hypothetical protein